jgi:hypothetical protein
MKKGYMPNRWEHLLDQQPVPLLEALLTEVAKRIAGDLKHWPLPIEGLDPETGADFAPLFAAGSVRPGDPVFLEAIRLAAWELERETQAVDDYLRNQRYQERGVGAPERRGLLLITRWLVEQLLALGEATEGRVKRKDLLRCLEQARARMQGYRAAP